MIFLATKGTNFYLWSMKEKPASFTIKHWCENDRPREKLLDKGRHVLTNAELIAILIGSGNTRENAVELSRRILSSVDHNLNALGKCSVTQLTQFKGIGSAKAVTIAAALELGRRRRAEEASEKVDIGSSASVFELMQPVIGELPHEEFWILYMNNSNKVIQTFQLSKGGITGTLVDIRLVLKNALELGATAIILTHNHPSGALRPSAADKQITQKLKTASDSIDIRLLDHIIVTDTAYFSFADKGLL